MRKPNLLLGSSIFWLALNTVEASPIYTWTDQAGRVHYSDQPPPDNTRRPEEITLPAVNLLQTTVIQPTDSSPKERKPPGGKKHPVPPFDWSQKDRQRRAEQCHKAKQRLRQVREKRRAGYGVDEGRKLRRQADKYRSDRQFYCN